MTSSEHGPEADGRRRRRGARGLRTRLMASVIVLAATGTVLGASPQPAVAALPPQTIADPVIYWNDVLLELIRREDRSSPGRMARAAAMLNAAMYDAESSYRLRWKGGYDYAPYLQADRYWAISEGPDEEERVIGRTAYNVLLEIFGRDPQQPDLPLYLDNKFRDRFGSEPTGEDILDHSIVSHVVNRMLTARTGDRSDNERAYTADNKPGAWRHTSYPDMPDAKCDEDSEAVDPNWGLVTPFTLTSGSQFRPTTPGTYGTYEKLLASDEYKKQVEAVRTLGADGPTARTPEEQITRTTEQEAAAWFWANDLDGTYKPPGQLIQATRHVAEARRLSTYQNARLFTLVSLALADAGIAVRDVKYQTSIDLWRPVSAIRESGIDPDWKPLLKNLDGVNVSPCFPAWASGHATFGSAWATVMARYFGTDNITFTMTTEDRQSPVRQRTFTSFSQAATENANSRVWLGVHFPWDATDGIELGKDVGNYVFDNELRSVR
ncbi:vanadium-dependent haloperoxidase [Streptomyces sp. YS415]|uniref:vanadium-dependent haloperoxidase n=1 Tax=Streptomyces sp. YS415 TaxID=2944806 RepID=UPI0020216F26|nr:vanadium-dependent haloperoxidase [Streptomyces sp. YS415]MCL7426042.1 vanadium-dependent haloperoxidase [Streptomyces sp. YS415]